MVVMLWIRSALLDSFIDLGVRWKSILRYVAFPCCGDVGVQAVLWIPVLRWFLYHCFSSVPLPFLSSPLSLSSRTSSYFQLSTLINSDLVLFHVTQFGTIVVWLKFWGQSTKPMPDFFLSDRGGKKWVIWLCYGRCLCRPPSLVEIP